MIKLFDEKKDEMGDPPERFPIGNALIPITQNPQSTPPIGAIKAEKSPVGIKKTQKSTGIPNGQKNPEYFKLYSREWRKNNRERYHKIQKKYRQSIKGQEAHKIERKKRYERFKQKNLSLKIKNKIAFTRLRPDHFNSIGEWKRLGYWCKRRIIHPEDKCQICGIGFCSPEIHHINGKRKDLGESADKYVIPRKADGTYDTSNFCLLCPSHHDWVHKTNVHGERLKVWKENGVLNWEVVKCR